MLRGLVVRGKKNPLHFGLPTRLRLALKDAGLTRTGLAQRAGVSHPVVSSLDAGHSLTTVSTLVRLAMALGVSAGWLAFGMGEHLAPTPAPAADGMAERLRTIRMLRGHSRMELARMAQISAGTVSYIEQGGQAKVNTVEALAVALAVSPAWLAFGTEPQLFIPTRRGRPPGPSSTHAG